MKKVVVKKENNEININRVKENDFIGIFSSFGGKYIPASNQKGEFFIIQVSSVAKNSSLRLFSSMDELLKCFVCDHWGIFVFDTQKELKEWLLKD